ncbi:MAG: permease-like cell division protein FtsX [Pseudomonadota bacterium]
MPKQRSGLTVKVMPMALDRRGGASVVELGWRDRFGAALEHHQASARAALQRMLGNWITALMTALVIAVALSLPAMLYVVLDNLRTLSGHIEAQAQISLFMKLDVDENAQRQLAARIARRADVAQVEVITRDAALAEFREHSGYVEVLKMIDGNPLPGVVIVLPKTVTEAAALRTALAREPQVDIAQLDSAWLQKLAAMLAIGERLVQALAVAFALVVLLVVVSTIRLAIEGRREEILVVKLVGATDAFVRRPFLYTGLWFGLAGAVAAVALVGALVWWVAAPVATLVNLYGSTFALTGLGFTGSVVLVLAGASLGLGGAWVAVARHLRDVEPC